MRVDAHQHYWVYRSEHYSWIDERMEVLKRDFLPRDLRPLLQTRNIEGTVAVQARHDVEETKWLLELSDDPSNRILGVVGFVDLLAETVDEELERLSRHPKLVGIRHIAQDEEDDGFLARDDFRRGISALDRHGLTYDILIYPRQLPAAIELVESFPEQRFVLDHVAKPDVARGLRDPWASDLRRLSAAPHVHCKLSGLVTEANWKGWRPEDFEPFLEVALEAFGAERLMVGSDWPVCTLAATYDEVLELFERRLDSLPPEAREAVLGTNAVSFYRLKELSHAT